MKGGDTRQGREGGGVRVFLTSYSSFAIVAVGFWWFGVVEKCRCRVQDRGCGRCR